MRDSELSDIQSSVLASSRVRDPIDPPDPAATDSRWNWVSPFPIVSYSGALATLAWTGYLHPYDAREILVAVYVEAKTGTGAAEMRYRVADGAVDYTIARSNMTNLNMDVFNLAQFTLPGGNRRCELFVGGIGYEVYEVTLLAWR